MIQEFHFWVYAKRTESRAWKIYLCILVFIAVLVIANQSSVHQWVNTYGKFGMYKLHSHTHKHIDTLKFIQP